MRIKEALIPIILEVIVCGNRPQVGCVPHYWWVSHRDEIIVSKEL